MERRNPRHGTTRLAALVLALLAAAASLGFGKIARPTPYNPILAGAPRGPCNPRLGQADVVAGTDVGGRPVAPADLPNDGGSLGTIDVPNLTVRVKRPHGGAAFVDVSGLSAPQSCARSR